MNEAWPMVRLGAVTALVQRPAVPLPGITYRQIGVKLWGEGAYEREVMDGSQTKYGQLFRAETDDIIVNKIWARNGSVAVVQPSLAGCYGSGEFDVRPKPRAARFTMDTLAHQDSRVLVTMRWEITGNERQESYPPGTISRHRSPPPSVSRAAARGGAD